MSKKPTGMTLEQLVAGVGGGDPVTPATETPTGTTGTPGQVVPISVLVTPADRLRVRMLAIESGTSVQQLGLEAWSMLLEKRGLPPLTKTTANVPSGRKR